MDTVSSIRGLKVIKVIQSCKTYEQRLLALEWSQRANIGCYLKYTLYIELQKLRTILHGCSENRGITS